MRPCARLLGITTFVWAQVTACAASGQTLDSMRACMAKRWSSPRLLEEGADPALDITQASLSPGQRGEVYIIGRGPLVRSESSVYLKVPFVAFRVAPDGTPTRLGAPPFSGD